MCKLTPQSDTRSHSINGDNLREDINSKNVKHEKATEDKYKIKNEWLIINNYIIRAKVTYQRDLNLTDRIVMIYKMLTEKNKRDYEKMLIYW